MHKNALIIFVRNSKLGKVKTRLAKTIGNEASLKVYELLLRHTLEITQPLHCDKIVYYSEYIEEKDIWHGAYQKKLQVGADLGVRMHNAFEEVFSKGYKNVVIIGSDIYDLTTAFIQEAFAMMQTHDIVIGPATDGGYYLLGMQTIPFGIFKGKAWGTPKVFEATMKTIKSYKIHMLKMLNDIDVYEDMVPAAAFQQFLKHSL